MRVVRPPVVSVHIDELGRSVAPVRYQPRRPWSQSNNPPHSDGEFLQVKPTDPELVSTRPTPQPVLLRPPR